MAMKGWVGIAVVVGALCVGACDKAQDGSQARASDATATEGGGDGAKTSINASRSGDRPPLRERMSPMKFDEQFKKAAGNRPTPAERAKTKGATWGYRVTSVEVGSQAEKQGIKVGDVIVAIDGQRAWGEGQLASLRKDGPQVLTVVGDDLKPRDVTVRPGRIGVKGDRHWDPELVYVRGPHVDARWDDLVRVALATMWEQPDLAETAMARAIKKGYPADGLSDLVGYATAMPNEVSPERALAFARRRETSGEYGADLPAWPAMKYYAAIAEADFKTALEALREGAPDTLEDTSRLVDQLATAAGGATTRPADGQSPTEVSRRMKRTPLIPLCKGLNAWADQYLDHMHKDGRMPLRFMAPAGHFAPFVIRSIRPARDVEVEVTLRTRATDNVKSDFSRLTAVGLMDLADPRPMGLDQDGQAGGILGFAYWGDNGWMSVYHGYGDQVVQRPASFKLEELITVRLVHVGGWDEVFVNDERIAYVPWTAPCKKMALYIKSVGMDICVESIRFDALGEEPDAP